MADVIKNELRRLRENGNLPMNNESKQAKQINSLWNVSLNTGLDKTATVAAFPKSPQIPTMIVDKTCILFLNQVSMQKEMYYFITFSICI